MAVHDKDICGENFTDLAKDLTTFLQEKKVRTAIERIERCKNARLDATVPHGTMDSRHANVFNLVDYLHKCINEINRTVKFAEAY